MSSIVTFYSYKGGVGRSMALANIAVLLANRGLKVLVVDFDLEAPGIERYFSYFEIRNGEHGLLRMFMQAHDGEGVNYRDFTSHIELDNRNSITLLSSGRDRDPTYSRNLESFDWGRFFAERHGAEFVERLRSQWLEDFDLVLVDSRTGLSDTGGICTIQLPDIVVAMFTANYQSLYGVRDVIRLAQLARQRLAYERMSLTVLPLPARWGLQEFQETQIWLDRITDGVEEFFADWLPRPLRPRDVLEQLKVPQRDYFGFGEKLAVVEQGTSDPTSMGYVYDRVAALLATDMADIEALLGQKAAATVKSYEPELDARTQVQQRLGYQHDVYISHDGRSPEATLDFVENLKVELRRLLSLEPRIFVDLGELHTSAPRTRKSADALLRSRLLVAILTPGYLNTQIAMSELLTFVRRSDLTGRNLLVPVTLGGTTPPAQVQRFDAINFPRPSLRLFGIHWARSSGEYMRLADRLQQLLKGAPEFDKRWTYTRYSPKLDQYAKGLRGKPGVLGTVSGRWRGAYEQGSKRTSFTLRAKTDGSGGFVGQTEEGDGLGPAVVEGSYDGITGIMRFVKRYTSPKTHKQDIHYIGAHVGGGKVRGKWFIFDDEFVDDFGSVSDTFEMEKVH